MTEEASATADGGSPDGWAREGLDRVEVGQPRMTSTSDVDIPDESVGHISAWRSVVHSAGVRVLVLPVSAILGILSTRVIVQNFGPAAYAQYGLLIAVGALLPFADMGVSAAIMNAVGASDDPRTDDNVRRVLITSIRVLIGSGLTILTISIIISALGLWPTLLGDSLLPGSGPIAAGLCLAIIAVSLPLGFGQRILTGLGKNHVLIGLNGLLTPIVLSSLLLVVKFGKGEGGYIPLIPYLATMLLAAVAVVIAGRLIRPQVGSALRAVPRLRTERGGRVADVAWPMLIQAVALPVAMQTDRLVLSHVSDSANLARYNLSAQMFLPVWQVITAAGAALWPIFARARARRSTTANSPMPIAAGFAGAAAGACILISVVSPWLARIASGGQITVPLPMLVAFSAFMIFQAIQYPLGTFLTDARGLRYQAVLIVMMVPFNLGVSIALAAKYGAVGPIIGSALSALIFQAVGNLVYVRRRLAVAKR